MKYDETLNKINICIDYIKKFFKESKGEKAVIGISGGKDSTVAAALCVQALGKENVIGVLMPNGEQKDINDAERVCNFLDIKYSVSNIQIAYNSLIATTRLLLMHTTEFEHVSDITVSDQTKLNLAPRLRMTLLYAIAQTVNGRVINTTNACERFVGYGTLFGDTVGDLALLKNLTVSEIYEIGDALGLPYDLVHKTPADGLTGKSDEDVLGVFYSEIETYMKTNGKVPECDWHEANPYFPGHFIKIYELHKNSEFKRQIINVPGPEF
jgi:NAD+ synthase